MGKFLDDFLSFFSGNYSVYVFCLCWHVTGNSSLRSPSLCSCWTEWADGLVWSHVYPVQHLCCPGERVTFARGWDLWGWFPRNKVIASRALEPDWQDAVSASTLARWKIWRKSLAFLCLSFRIEKWGCHQCPLQRVFRRAQWENFLKAFNVFGTTHTFLSNVSSCCYTCNS